MHSILRPLPVLLVLHCLALFPAAAADLVWTNLAGGSWTTASNWSPNAIPGVADNAYITNNGAYTVLVGVNASARVVVGGNAGGQVLEQTAAVLTLGSGSRIAAGGTLRWRDGTLSGQFTVQAGGIMSLEGGATKNLNAAVTNQGTIQLGGTGELYLYGNNGARIENEGLFEYLADRDLYGINGSPAFRNTGTVRKTGGTGIARLGVAGSYPVLTENIGTIESSNGLLQLFGGGTVGGQFITATNARIELVGGAWTENAPVISGPGATRLTGGSIFLRNAPANLVFAGGSVLLRPDFQNGGAITNLNLDGAILGGTNRITGTLRWRDGTLSGQLTVQVGGTMILEGTATKTLNASVTNRGTIQIGGTGELYLYGNNGARIENEGLFEYLADRDLYGINGSPAFRNTGTVRKTGGTGIARLGVAGAYPVLLENSGTINSSSGTLQLFGGGILAGQLTTSTNARIDLVGGAWTENGVMISGSGLSRLTGGSISLRNAPANLIFSGGSVRLLPDFQNGGAITNFTLEGATLDGTNHLAGTFRWRDGIIAGQLTVQPGAVLVTEGSSTKTLYGSLINRGTVQFGGTGELYIYGNNGGRITNEGLFDYLGDRYVYGINGFPPIVNHGTIRKSAGTGTAYLGIPNSYPVALDNTNGTVEVLSGVIQIFGGGILGGRFITQTNARIDFAGGTWVEGLPLISGPGQTRFNAGTVSLRTAPSNLVFTGGTVLLMPEFQGGNGITNLTLAGSALGGTNRVIGTLTLQDATGPLTVGAGALVNWTGGDVSQSITVESNALFTMTGNAVKTLRGPLTNRGVVRHQESGSLYLYGNDGARVENIGLWDLQSNAYIYGINGTPVFQNRGEFRRSAGTSTANIGVANSYPVIFINLGQVVLQTGVLQLHGNSSFTGQYVTSPGARLEFAGPVWTQQTLGINPFSGGGTFRFTAGTLRLLDVIPNLELTGGTVELLPGFQGGNGITNLTLAGTTLGGTNVVRGTLTFQDTTGPLTVAPGGTVNWTGGTMSRPIQVEAGGVLNLTGNSTKTVQSTLTNRGVLAQQGVGSIYLYGNNGAYVENHGLWDIRGDGDLYGINGNPRFRNLGVIRKSSGTGAANMGVNSSYPIILENAGVVESAAGTLSFYGTYLLTNGTLRSGISSATSFGRITFVTPPSLSGTLGAYFIGNYSAAASNRFPVITFPSASGTFASFDLPAGVAWQTEYRATDVSLTALGACTAPPAGLAAWWPAEGNSADVLGGPAGILRNGATYSTGQVGQAFSFDGLDDFIEVDNSPALNPTTAITLTAWIRPRASTGADRDILSKDGRTSDRQYLLTLSDQNRLRASVEVAGGFRSVESTNAAVSNQWQHVALTFDGTRLALYLNGRQETSLTVTGALASGTQPFRIGGGAPGADGAMSFAGLIDEPAVFNRALTSNEVAAIYSSGALGICRPTQPPIIVTHPQSRTNAPGSVATFSAIVGGSAPLVFQWQFNGVALSDGGRISGSRSNVLTVTSVQAADAGAYSLIVSNTAGAVTSQPAQLIFDANPPAIAQLAVAANLTTAVVTWQTDEPATGTIEYGPTTSYGFTNRYTGGLRTQHSITLSSLNPGTTYQFRVRTSDFAGNETISANGTFATTPAPDLVPQLLVSPGSAQVGQLISLVYAITNIGPGAASNGWYNALVTANDANGAGQQLLGYLYFVPGAGGLQPGSSVTLTQSVILPASAAGSRYLGVRLDYFNSQVEVNETNNTVYAPAPVPITAIDLHVARITAPATGFFGENVAVNFTITNSGNAAASFPWKDRVYLSPFSNSLSGATLLGTFDALLTPLGAGQFYTNRATVTLPLNTQLSPGRFYLVVEADATREISELNENNNLGSIPINLMLPPLPDLAVAALPVPALAQPGQAIALHWTVTNRGSLTVTGTWSETVYLATNSAGGGSSELSTTPFTNSLAPGEFIARTQSVVVPLSSTLGNVWFAVAVDSRGNITEENETNNLRVAESPTLIPAVLTLSPATSVVSEAVSQPLRMTVTRNGSRTAGLTVTISNPDPSELSAPATVVIPAGQASANFDLTPVADGIVDGPQVVLIGVSASGFTPATAHVTVLDGDVPRLTLRLGSNSVPEGLLVSATVSRDAGTNLPVTVTSTSSNPSQVLPPTPVTIPAGAFSVSFAFLALEDLLVEGPVNYTLSVSAPGYTGESAIVTVLDNDVPSVALHLAASTVSENAGPQATSITFTRDPVTSRALELDLESSNTNAARLSASVTIPANDASVTVPVAAVDNLVIDGTKSVQLRAWIKATGTGTRLTVTAPVTLLVTDNDGPALQLAVDRDLLIEGASPAAFLTITRTTSTNEPLEIALVSTEPIKARVPASVTIPAGTNSLIVPVNSTSDGAVTGNQPVTFTASADGFTSAVIGATISDFTLPDLVIASISHPAVAQTEEFVTLGYQLLNQGSVAASSNALVQRVYLSTDPLVGNDTLIGQYTFAGGLPAGAQFGQTFTVRLPQEPGAYWVIVEADVANAVPEIFEQNNTRISSAPIRVVAAYDAEVTTTLDAAPAGTPVPLTGRAFRTNGTPAAFTIVNIHILVRDTRRIVAALTDGSGNFATTWQPLAGEAGSYRIGAAHPGAVSAPIQDTFTLHGMRANPTALNLTIAEQSSAAGVITLINQSDLPLSGMAVEILNKPSNLDVAVTLRTNRISGAASNHLSYAISVLSLTSLQGSMTLRVTSDEGAITDIPINVRIEPLRPRLVANPAPLISGMKRGVTRTIEVSVSNAGGAPSGPIFVSLPSVPWISLVSPNPIPSLNPGETNTITLSLTPAADLPLTIYNGNLALNATGVGLSVPYQFRALSEAKGDLVVIAVDEFTYYATGAPRVTNAAVTVRDALSRAVITNGVTGSNGQLLIAQLPEGYYDVDVTAAKHKAFHGTQLVVPGVTNEITSFMSRETVRYTWTVEKIEIEDRYKIVIETEFEANVPAPVVTLDPPVLSVADLTVVGQLKQVNLTIRNHGLIAVDNTRIAFGTHPYYSIEPLIDNIGRLDARSSITVPVTLRRIGGPAPVTGGLMAKGSGGGAPCGMTGNLGFEFECGPFKISGGSPIGVSGVQGDCGGRPVLTGGGGTGGGGGSGGGGGGGGGGGVVAGGSSVSIGIKLGCDPTCLVLAAGGCIPGPVGCAFGGAACGKGLAEDFGALSVADCAVGAAACVFPPAAIPGCIYSLARCFIGPASTFADQEMFLALSKSSSGGSASGSDPLLAFKPGVRALLDVVGLLSGAPDTVWFNPEADNRTGDWFERFLLAANPGSDGGRSVSSGERANLVTGVQPPGVPASEIQRFLDRWNRSLVNWAAGILRPADAPPGANLDFIDSMALREKMILAGENHERAVAAGFSDPISAIVETVRFRAQNGEGGGTCARVKLRLDQEAVISREAFRATLEFENGDSAIVENLRVTLKITDASGRDAAELFGIRPPELTGLSDIDGGGRIPIGATGTARWTIVPTVDAAPLAPVVYYVSGTLRYSLNGVVVTVPLTPYDITVNPTARLTVQYFHQRDVYSDDPHTPEIEPSVPFSLAVMVLNKGAGPARNFRITSAQPQIIENEKGLLIDFKVLATEVAGKNLTPSLTANMGTIAPGGIGIARWLLSSTLQGLFINYSATFEHLDGFGNPKLSLIDEVSIHEMVRLVQAGGPFEDHRPDFLVNDEPDLRDLPDTLYLSDGSTNSVAVVTNGLVTGTLSAGNLQVQLNAPLPGGWSYLRVADPGNGQYRLTGVRRSDNVVISVNTNAWVTDRTFLGQGTRPVRENVLHLLDYNSTGTYTLLYEPSPASDTLPPVSTMAVLPETSRVSIPLSWSGADNTNGSGIAFYDVYVSENGGPFQRWLSETLNTSAIYQGTLGRTYAFYSIAVDRAGNRQVAPTAPDAQTLVAQTNRPPLFTALNDVTVVEGETVTVQLSGSDPDGDSLSFSLEAGAPAGMLLNLGTARLTWVTSESHGPSTNRVTVRLRDSGTPPLEVVQSFNVIVLEDNTAPTLAALVPQVIAEGQLLTVTNLAYDADLPAQCLTFILGSGAPAGVSIDAATGVLRWRPSAVQGGTTNQIRVIVQDDQVPPLSATQTLVVIVRDTAADFILSIGTTNVLAGETGSVPLLLTSGLDLTNLSFVIEADATRLGNFLLAPLAPGINSATLAPAGTNRSRLNFESSVALPLQGNLTLGRLDFTSLSNRHSAIVPLTVTNLTGIRASGESVTNVEAYGGRVIVVGEEPVLVARGLMQRSVVLYAQPGLCVTLQSTTNLLQPVWQTVNNYSVTGRSLEVPLPSVTNSPVFYRALVCNAAAPILLLRVEANRSGTLVLTGKPGLLYRVEHTTQLTAPLNWTTLTNLTLESSRLELPGLVLTNGMRLFRAVAP